MESFKDIDETYEVSNLGTIRNKTNGRILKGHIRRGYRQVKLHKKNWDLHRLIALHFIDNPNNYPFVDHYNGITTDNSIKNLRWVTPQQNIMNRGIQSNNTSGFIGVTFHKANKTYTAQITVNKQQRFLGQFATAELASEARKKYRIDNNLEFFRDL
jgi:hypothetical protein